MTVEQVRSVVSRLEQATGAGMRAPQRPPSAAAHAAHAAFSNTVSMENIYVRFLVDLHGKCGTAACAADPGWVAVRQADYTPAGFGDSQVTELLMRVPRRQLSCSSAALILR